MCSHQTEQRGLLRQIRMLPMQHKQKWSQPLQRRFMHLLEEPNIIRGLLSSGSTSTEREPSQQELVTTSLRSQITGRETTRLQSQQTIHRQTTAWLDRSPQRLGLPTIF